ncbi:MAG: GAF domain-containing protein [Candidatus Cyclobacteriaceae bacterium M3_2C_046]
MKSLYSRIGYFFILLFVLGILFSAYYLFNIPTQLQEQTSIIDLNNLSEIQPVLYQLNLILGGVLLSGLVAITFTLFIAKNADKENIVYVEKYREKENHEESDEVISEEENQYDAGKLDEIKVLITQTDHEKMLYHKLISKICKDLEASQGAIYKSIVEEDRRYIKLISSFAFSIPDSELVTFEFGEGLAGQVAKEGRLINIKSVPDGYINILSGLGNASPKNLIIIPILENEKVYGVVEIASFKVFTKNDENYLKEVMAVLSARIEEFEQEPVTEMDKNDK